MTIRYADGRAIKAVILSANLTTMRVAVKGGGDAVALKCVNGTWMSEHCEPVEIQFEWQRRSATRLISVTDCICPKELPTQFSHLLLIGGDDEPQN